jgi:hypothetical protein
MSKAPQIKPHGVGYYALPVAAITALAFAVYWTSSFSLEQRAATKYFGADSWHFTELAQGHFNDRILRLHPVTVALALGWMKIFSPLTAWIAPVAILKAMFAFIGAIGVGAAVHAFSAFMPRTYALLWGAVYGSSMSIWYFSSIEESKIVSATLAAIYIALYVNFRNDWTPRRAAILTGALFIACLNEITAAFLAAIPVVDTFLKHKFDLRQWRWIFVHALAAPLALLALETIRRIVPAIETKDGTNFVEIFLWYVTRNTYDFKTATDFLQRWLFFNIAAPEPEINFADAAMKYGGDFEPAISHYFDAPVSAVLVFAFAFMLFSCFWTRESNPDRGKFTGIMLALAAYALVRMGFFFIFLPGECLLYSPSVTLAHLLLLAVPFMASEFRYKGIALAVTAALLFANNAIFVFTAQTFPYAGP